MKYAKVRYKTAICISTAVEWYRQVYVHFNMWKLNSWIYNQFETLGGTEIMEENQRRSPFIVFDPGSMSTSKGVNVKAAFATRLR
eukprot:IDg15543t1